MGAQKYVSMLFMTVENGTDEMASGEMLGLVDALRLFLLQVDESADTHTNKDIEGFFYFVGAS